MAELFDQSMNMMLTSQYFFIEKFSEATCIAVCDESQGSAGPTEQQWTDFRNDWPLRPYYLLQPQTTLNVAAMELPANMASDLNTDGVSFGVIRVNRDNGSVGSLSDWFTICNVNTLSPGDNVFLFVDVSGSMVLNTVIASYSKFINDCSNAGINVYEVLNGQENYVDPFITWQGAKIN